MNSLKTNAAFSLHIEMIATLDEAKINLNRTISLFKRDGAKMEDVIAAKAAFEAAEAAMA